MALAVGSIPVGGPIGLCLVPTSASQLVYQKLWYVIFCLCKSAYKRSLAAIERKTCSMFPLLRSNVCHPMCFSCVVKHNKLLTEQAYTLKSGRNTKS